MTLIILGAVIGALAVPGAIVLLLILAARRFLGC